MSEFKGTPGPWFMEDGKDDGWIIANGDNLVCMVNDGLTHEEMSCTEKHDSKLIMAAPDLLQALLMLQKQALQSELNNPNHEWGLEALAAARAAIAKALGEQK